MEVSIDDQEAIPMDNSEKSIHHCAEEVGDSNQNEVIASNQQEAEGSHTNRNGIIANQARFISRNPWIHLVVSFIASLAISALGYILAGLPRLDNTGWLSRGTLIADRTTQMHILRNNLENLKQSRNEKYWKTLTETPQDNLLPNARRLVENDSTSKPRNPDRRYLQSWDGCQVYYEPRTVDRNYYLTSMWKVEDGMSALDKAVVKDICRAEENTLYVLNRKNLCQKCGGQCLPPLSIVFYARIHVEDYNFKLSCEDLADRWESKSLNVTSELSKCVDELKEIYSPELIEMPRRCQEAFFFWPTLVDGDFGAGQTSVSYTSSTFLTNGRNTNALYKLVDEYDRAEDSEVVQGAYDTKWNTFADTFAETALNSDTILAAGSALITAIAILVHTRSIWITVIGLFQICLSFPLAYFMYTIAFGLQYFPLLNFIGIYVLFALGADDIFVAMDKWKNGRLDNPNASTEDVAAVTLPDAAGAMLLTTATTAVAFFGTALCQVAALRVFGIFCGLLVVFDYLMCILLVFPALCIYDKWLSRGNNFCCSCHICKKRPRENDVATENNNAASLPHATSEFVNDEARNTATEELIDMEKNSFIRRVMSGFYFYFHKIRWIVFVLSIAAIIVSSIFAARLELPKDSEVRLLNENVEFEKNYNWKQNLLETVLRKSVGSAAMVIFGITPADTGDHNNPLSGSRLVLDETFNPSTQESQTYMLDFCKRFMEQDFASTENGYECPMVAFNEWLGEMTNITDNSTGGSYVYQNYCGSADGLPMPEDDFHLCLSEWANEQGISTVLQRNEIVQVIYFYYRARVRFDRPFNELKNEWNLIEDWMEAERTRAPSGTKNGYQTSIDYWWFDTNDTIQRSAYVSAGIALAFASLVVLISSRSIILVLFSLLTIGYVLTSTTAMLVASGWTLGFLESICFAILIGVSCDFVIHFGHAYAHLPGDVSRHERTQYALVRMGPSILAAAFTTISAALIMVFTVIAFFQQFAKILLFTILQATVGSFFVYTALSDCIGPSNPTYLVYKIFGKCSRCACKIMSKCCKRKADENKAKESGCRSKCCKRKANEEKGDGENMLASD